MGWEEEGGGGVPGGFATTNVTSSTHCFARHAHPLLCSPCRSRINTKLHPFVVNERNRLKARDHLRGVNALDRNSTLPDALKHHSGYHEVYGWLLTAEQHQDRMKKLTPSVQSALPRHCREYKALRDKNRFKSMSAQQKKLFLQRRRDEKVKKQEVAERKAKRRAQVQEDEKKLEAMKLASPTSDYSVTGLREAKLKNVGDVREKDSAAGDYVEKRKKEIREARSIRRNDSSGFSTPKMRTGASYDPYSTPDPRSAVYVDSYPRFDPSKNENYRTDNVNAREYGSAKLRGTSSTGMSPHSTPIRRPKSSGAATRPNRLKFKMVHAGGLINTVESIMRTGVATQHRLNHKSARKSGGTWQDDERGDSIRSRSERRVGGGAAVWRDDDYDYYDDYGNGGGGITDTLFF